MDTLDRYLIKEIVIYFVLVLLGFGVLFIAIDFLSKFWGSEMSFTKILWMYFYMLPGTLQQFVPVASLMSTLLVLSQMSKQNEILALYSGGVSSLRVVSTFIAAVATLTTLSFLLFDPLVPIFEKKRDLIKRGLDPNQENIITFNRQGFWYRSGGIIYNVGRYNTQNDSLEGINVFELTPDFGIKEKHRAKLATYSNEKWSLVDGFSVLYPDSNFPEATPFTSIEGLIPEKPSDYKSLQVKEETMRLKELRKQISRNKSYGLDTTSQQVNYHERVALIFTPLILVLLGISFSMKPLKNQSTAKSIAYCFLIVFAYLLLFRLTVSVGKGGFIPAIVAGWIPNLLFLSLALTLILRKKQYA